jgi:hypothetical protein
MRNMIYIMTRIGIGVRAEAFYRKHLLLASLTVVPSLRVQSDKRFKWVVLIDKRAPLWVEDRIGSFGIPHEVWRIDPLEESINPNRTVTRWLKRHDARVYVARIDDDDLLHRDFVARALGALDGVDEPAVLTFPRGAYLYHDKVTLHDYPYIAIGLTTYAPDRNFNCFSAQHNKFVEKIGIQVKPLELPTEGPMWIRTWRASSVSSTARGVVDTGTPHQLRHAEFGLNRWTLWKLQRVLKADRMEQEISYSGEKPKDVLAMKNYLLADYKTAMKNQKLETAQIIAQIFYRI